MVPYNLTGAPYIPFHGAPQQPAVIPFHHGVSALPSMPMAMRVPMPPQLLQLPLPQPQAMMFPNPYAVVNPTMLPPTPFSCQWIPPHQQQQLLPSLPVVSTPVPTPLMMSAPLVTLPVPPVLRVQDRPAHVTPVFNGVNPDYPGLVVLHRDPPVFAVDGFLSDAECDFLVRAASDSFAPAPVVGAGGGEISPDRTSDTCYLSREDLPALLRKVSLLTGKPPRHCELPQVGRYRDAQRYRRHHDAFDLGTTDGRRYSANGGQRVVTVLVYLNDLAPESGGRTTFPSLEGLEDVVPKRGRAVVFFPATVDGYLDGRTLHEALPVRNATKYVSQIWIRQGNYHGQPSKRLNRVMDDSILHDHHPRHHLVCDEGDVAMEED